MDWLTGLTRAIDYVEEHLEEEIDYNAAAREAACSGYYFQRVFGLLCGMTLGEYVRNRRLTLAGYALREPGARVIDVALRFGYESPESFARAFQRFHGVPPSEARRNGVTLRSFSRLSVKLTLCGGTAMDYKIVEKEAFTVMEKVEMHRMDEEENAKSIPEFWTRSHQDGTVATLAEKTCDPSAIFGICYSGETEKSSFAYAIGAKCDPTMAVPEGFRKTTIPARTWVVFSCRGAMPEAMQSLWHRIASEFFPTWDYSPTMELDVEVYTPGDMGSPDYQSEIWVPVTKK